MATHNPHIAILKHALRGVYTPKSEFGE